MDVKEELEPVDGFLGVVFGLIYKHAKKEGDKYYLKTVLEEVTDPKINPADISSFDLKNFNMDQTLCDSFCYDDTKNPPPISTTRQPNITFNKTLIKGLANLRLLDEPQRFKNETSKLFFKAELLQALTIDIDSNTLMYCCIPQPQSFQCDETSEKFNYNLNGKINGTIKEAQIEAEAIVTPTDDGYVSIKLQKISIDVKDYSYNNFSLTCLSLKSVTKDIDQEYIDLYNLALDQAKPDVIENLNDYCNTDNSKSSLSNFITTKVNSIIDSA